MRSGASRLERRLALKDRAADLIGQAAIVVDSTFTDPAYTWSRPGSTWAQRAIQQLHQVGIRQIGRYGAWQFQGMVESFEQGLFTSGTRNSESREEMDGSSAASA